MGRDPKKDAPPIHWAVWHTQAATESVGIRGSWAYDNKPEIEGEDARFAIPYFAAAIDELNQHIERNDYHFQISENALEASSLLAESIAATAEAAFGSPGDRGEGPWRANKKAAKKARRIANRALAAVEKLTKWRVPE